MSILHASFFGVVAALVVGGADYAMTMNKQEGREYSLLDHIEFRMGDLMAGSGVAKALPRAPSGWDVRDASPEDSLRITGQPVDPATLAAIVALNDKMIAALPGLQTEDRVYRMGDAEVFLDISFVPSNMKDARAVKVISQMFSMIDGKATDVAMPHEGAVALRKFSGPEYGKATAYYAVPDGQIFISALSTATEEQTLTLLAGIDQGALQTLVMNDPTIGKAPDAVAEKEPEKAEACVQKGAAKFCSSNN